MPHDMRNIDWPLMSARCGLSFITTLMKWITMWSLITCVSTLLNQIIGARDHVWFGLARGFWQKPKFRWRLHSSYRWIWKIFGSRSPTGYPEFWCSFILEGELHNSLAYTATVLKTHRITRRIFRISTPSQRITCPLSHLPSHVGSSSCHVQKTLKSFAMARYP